MKKYLYASLFFIFIFGFIGFFLIQGQRNMFITGQSIESTPQIILSGFDKNTVIEPLWEDKNGLQSREISVSKNNQREENINFSHQISYRIKNQHSLIDINIAKKENKISAQITGLETGSKVAIHDYQGKNSNFIPADWAGRLILESFQDKNFCISFIKTKKSTICHINYNGVAS